MKKTAVFFIIAISLFLCACVKNSAEIDYYNQGMQQLEDHKFDEAIESFSKLLKDSDDSAARAMYIQALHMKNAMDYVEYEDYKKAIKELDIIIKMKEGSSAIKSEATKKKDEYNKTLKDIEEEMSQRKEKAKKSAKGDLDRVREIALKANYKHSAKIAAEKAKADAEKAKSQTPTTPSGDSGASSGASTPSTGTGDGSSTTTPPSQNNTGGTGQ
ncbi:MAG: tetratricopeptide repeat protein [Clostridioides sp.]|jgi:hypothetical protein|nr:tetratricopeptide repeat protein [Clostridioides sp.]